MPLEIVSVIVWLLICVVRPLCRYPRHAHHRHAFEWHACELRRHNTTTCKRHAWCSAWARVSTLYGSRYADGSGFPDLTDASQGEAAGGDGSDRDHRQLAQTCFMKLLRPLMGVAAASLGELVTPGNDGKYTLWQATLRAQHTRICTMSSILKVCGLSVLMSVCIKSAASHDQAS